MSTSPIERSWPNGFLWGAATAAAQVEGAAHEDGKEDSIWDHFARVPNAVQNGDTPEVAVDQYHRVPQDIALMKELGLDAYRFSTSWARIKPGDRGVNQAGLDFYSRLVDGLLEADILPWLTLYHWDLPQAVEEAGGWPNRDTAYRYLDYAEVVYDALGDRVSHWTTFNEPLCSSLIGYAAGDHAPGRQEPAAALAALHHQHLGHGLVVQRLRERSVSDERELQLGITLNLTNAIPADASDPIDIDAARRVDALWNRAFLDPILEGSYPDDLIRDVGELGLSAVIQAGDLEIIHQPIDFLGVNHYHDDAVSGHPSTVEGEREFKPTDRPTRSAVVGSDWVTFPLRGFPRTAMGWEVNPDGLRKLLVRLGDAYPSSLPPLFVTENGAAYEDVVADDGAIHDTERAAYITDHIAAVGAAIDEGADVRGYFVWSLLDNFEWAWGYGKRFGVIRVDYDTLERTIKDSGLQYSRILEASRASAGV
ncbi:GH1 family beta-glucosidase [Lacisediminihabitans changchengi]|uniref:Beta-glucosidase n=1 Tax=Lacisediminihabitans changchengi TaxID=2787634 RepID=A0A934SQT1_9MICO|nr:GH1 family beta-glucosidase [Lacisediminihabitans changchengi]MBK4347348.1 beta-glucosidase [Lacisediminihabitans changchengi]